MLKQNSFNVLIEADFLNSNTCFCSWLYAIEIWNHWNVNWNKLLQCRNPQEHVRILGSFSKKYFDPLRNPVDGIGCAVSFQRWSIEIGVGRFLGGVGALEITSWWCEKLTDWIMIILSDFHSMPTRPKSCFISPVVSVIY